MQFLKPKRLREGSTIAVLSPSWGGPSLYPHVFDLGLQNIERAYGWKIKEFETARMDAAITYANPRLRAEDLNRAFADPEVDAIFASIGGDDSVRILPYLDLDLIRANPKILMGYSDTAVINGYLCSQGLVTYNGPSVMAGFAQMRHLPEAFTTHVGEFLTSPTDTYTYRPYEAWADRYLPWDAPGYDGETIPLVRNTEGWHWLQGARSTHGHLYGGCIEVFEFLKGTRFWPEPGFFKNKILFFETSEDKPPVANIKYMLRNYGTMGVLDEIAGLLFGRARAYTDEEKADLDKTILQTVAGEFARQDLPIVTNIDFGHTDPQLILPLGIQAQIDCPHQTLKLLEPALT